MLYPGCETRASTSQGAYGRLERVLLDLQNHLTRNKVQTFPRGRMKSDRQRNGFLRSLLVFHESPPPQYRQLVRARGVVGRSKGGAVHPDFKRLHCNSSYIVSWVEIGGKS